VLGERFPGVPRMALTATADGRTQREIVQRLGLGAAAALHRRVSTARTSATASARSRACAEQLLAFLRAQHRTDSRHRLLPVAQENRGDRATGSAITATRAAYHAGMDAAETRAANQSRFLREDGLIVVATVAFGMGIDKPDVRFVAHLDLPKTVESYYQETGRAGRDGLPANAWLATACRTWSSTRQMLAGQRWQRGAQARRAAKFNAMLGLCESTGCRRQALLAYFGEELPRALRQLRQLPRPARHLGRHRGGALALSAASTAPGSASA
jgi:ATP-dependent DNA helicase RecQ